MTSTSSVETSSNCGDAATGYYEEYVTADARYVIVSGAPAHAAEYDQDHANPNVRCERWQYVKLPLTWSDSGSTTQQMGATGYVTSGTTTFDARSSPDGNLAAYYEWDSLDPYFGHSDQSKQYHYHAVCIRRVICILTLLIYNLRCLMDGQVPMILPLVNTLVTCMMEANFTDSVAMWILAMFKPVVVMPPMKVIIPTLTTLIAN